MRGSEISEAEQVLKVIRVYLVEYGLEARFEKEFEIQGGVEEALQKAKDFMQTDEYKSTALTFGKSNLFKKDHILRIWGIYGSVRVRVYDHVNGIRWQRRYSREKVERGT